MPFASKGFERQGAGKQEELRRALSLASRDGLYPVLVDTSPCLFRLKESALFEADFPIYEPAEFILKVLRPGLAFRKSAGRVALHSPCSSRKMGLDGALRQVAELWRRGGHRPRQRGLLRVRRRPGLQPSRAHRLRPGPPEADLPSSCSRATPPARPARSACRCTPTSPTSRSPTWWTNARWAGAGRRGRRPPRESSARLQVSTAPAVPCGSFEEETADLF